MRTFLIAIALLVGMVSPASAQQRMTEEEVHARMMARQLPALRKSADDLAKALSRDAFITAQIVAATHDIESDFRTSAALGKAINRIDEARKRANEEPRAAPSTQILLESLREMLDKARDQGFATDLPNLQKEILRRSHQMQRLLFDEMNAARRLRAMLVELQTAIFQSTDRIDAGMTEALESTFLFFEAGGQ